MIPALIDDRDFFRAGGHGAGEPLPFPQGTAGKPAVFSGLQGENCIVGFHCGEGQIFTLSRVAASAPLRRISQNAGIQRNGGNENLPDAVFPDSADVPGLIDAVLLQIAGLAIEPAVQREQIVEGISAFAPQGFRSAGGVPGVNLVIQGSLSLKGGSGIKDGVLLHAEAVHAEIGGCQPFAYRAAVRDPYPKERRTLPADVARSVEPVGKLVRHVIIRFLLLLLLRLLLPLFRSVEIRIRIVFPDAARSDIALRQLFHFPHREG